MSRGEEFGFGQARCGDGVPETQNRISIHDKTTPPMRYVLLLRLLFFEDRGIRFDIRGQRFDGGLTRQCCPDARTFR